MKNQVVKIILIMAVVTGINWFHVLQVQFFERPNMAQAAQENIYQDSPFGFHPALVNMPSCTNNGYCDAQNIGVTWNRPSLYALWYSIQPDINLTDYQWAQYDNLYGKIPVGINILANIATQMKTDWGYELAGSYMPVDTDKYVAFVKAAVERYDGDGVSDMPGLVNPIKYWQVGNEPNDILKKDFSSLQSITYTAVKEACPDCTVLIGGVPGMPPSDNYLKYFNSQYKPILDALQSGYVDVMDIHWYGNATGDYKGVKDVYNYIRSVLNTDGFPDMPIWITEMGSYSGQPVNYSFQTERQQALDYLKRFVYPLSFGVKKVFPAFGLSEGFKYNNGYFDCTGLIYDGVGYGDPGSGVKKLAYYTYKLMTEKLEGSDWNNVQTIQESDHVYIYKFTKDNKPIYVAWWDYFDEPAYQYGDVKTTKLNADFTGDVMVTRAVPDANGGVELNENDYPNFFPTETHSVVNGQVTINLGEIPVFIEWPDSIAPVAPLMLKVNP